MHEVAVKRLREIDHGLNEQSVENYPKRGRSVAQRRFDARAQNVVILPSNRLRTSPENEKITTLSMENYDY